jgi:ketosteroid isomerase-like protein
MTQPIDTTAVTEAIRDAYAALNQNDISGFMQILDPDIERVEPEGFPMSGTYRGLEMVTAQFIQARSTWAEGGCEPERFLVDGDKVIVYVHVRVRLKDKNDWIDGRIADVFVWRSGKAIQFRTFADAQQALEWAGIEITDTN